MSAPATRPPVESGMAGLDERIRRVELRLIAREETIHNGFGALRLRVQRALDPHRFVTTGLLIAGVAAVGGGVCWAMRRRALCPEYATPATGRASLPSRAGAVLALSVIAFLPWPQLTRMAWPLMPAWLRRRASADLVGAGLNIGLPVLVRWLSASGRNAGVHRQG